VYPVINGLSDHDAQIIAISDIPISTPKQSFSLNRKIDGKKIKNFVYLLSYENWENVFIEEDVNIIYNNFVNTCQNILCKLSLSKNKKFTKFKTMVNQQHKSFISK
jgi:hypothetical protein